MSSLFLLSQIALNGMDTQKNDISCNDPKAFEKIAQHSVVLLKEFSEQIELLKASGKLSFTAMQSIQESSRALETMKKENIDLIQLEKEGQQIPENIKQQIVDVWNITKAASVQTIEAMKEVNKKNNL